MKKEERKKKRNKYFYIHFKANERILLMLVNQTKKI